MGKRLGTGSLADVYVATAADGRRVVVKRLRADMRDDPTRALMLLDEGELLMRLAHPHLVRCLAISASPAAIVLDRVEGEPLATILAEMRAQDRPLAVERALEITGAVAQALAYLHQHDVCHLDVGPDNVLVGRDGRAVLSDLARGRWPGRRIRIDYEPVPHKLGYCSPELWEGEPLGEHTDVYTLGVMLWEMVAGRPAEPARPPRHSRPMPPLLPLAAVRPGLPEQVVSLCEQMCARDPRQRPCAATLVSASLLAGSG